MGSERAVCPKGTPSPGFIRSPQTKTFPYHHLHQHVKTVGGIPDCLLQAGVLKLNTNYVSFPRLNELNQDPGVVILRGLER